MRTIDTLLLAFALTSFGCDKGASPPTAPPTDADTAAVPDAPASEADPGEETDPGPSGGEAVDPASDDPSDAEGASGGGEAVSRAPGDPVPVPKDPAEGLVEPTSFANIKLEIRTDAGKVYRDEGKVIGWEELTVIPIEFEGETHEFIVKASRSGKKSSLLMSYSRGGTEVLRKYTLESKIKKREVVRIEDGTALAVTVTPQTVKPHSRKRQKIDNPEGDDPLTGAGKK